MCMIDDEDRVTILQETTRKARKLHKCGECNRPIAQGESYLYEFGIIYGERVTYRTCEHCLVARKWLSTNCHGWIYEMVIEDIQEHAHDCAPLGRQLRRIVAGAKRKWQRVGGRGLFPIPDMPPPIEIKH